MVWEVLLDSGLIFPALISNIVHSMDIQFFPSPSLLTLHYNTFYLSAITSVSPRLMEIECFYGGTWGLKIDLQTEETAESVVRSTKHRMKIQNILEFSYKQGWNMRLIGVLWVAFNAKNPLLFLYDCI